MNEIMMQVFADGIMKQASPAFFKRVFHYILERSYEWSQ
jgi:hypothetical protein